MMQKEICLSVVEQLLKRVLISHELIKANDDLTYFDK